MSKFDVINSDSIHFYSLGIYLCFHSIICGLI